MQGAGGESQGESGMKCGGVWAGTDNVSVLLQQAADNKWQRCQRRPSFSCQLSPAPGALATRPSTSWAQSSAVDVAGASCAAGQRISVQCEMRSRG
ncbi:hypothetical protein M5D96_009548 [Drosophila gunungcola]|uniref:Uncharacterized protein n=1 Tax=Drosophila gunungcola TaxID=103775 RepID=A0A9Q0BLZ9_9MUSC|nr:hypothetical protein M5D96_009548 [Drosophila gunungcola]